jgi:cytochrome c
MRPTAFCVGLALLAGAADAAELGDPVEGERLYRLCVNCHEAGEGAANRVGPHLNRVFGRLAGSVDGFSYSKAMARAGADGLTWNLETLDAYIENPKSLVTGTRMRFPGVADPAGRGHLVAYIRTFSDNPSDIPEAVPTARPEGVHVDPAVLAIEGDAAFGAYLSSECVTCHLVDGGDQGIPSIAGWPQEDFVVAMHAYKQKLRPHPVMQMMAGRLSDDEIAALAAYFAGTD